jgi:hypothetical protein
MRPLVTDAFVASFQFAMEETSERAISDAIRRQLESGDPVASPDSAPG